MAAASDTDWRIDLPDAGQSSHVLMVVCERCAATYETVSTLTVADEISKRLSQSGPA
jgi:hypothetical protein